MGSINTCVRRRTSECTVAARQHHGTNRRVLVELARHGVQLSDEGIAQSVQRLPTTRRSVRHQYAHLLTGQPAGTHCSSWQGPRQRRHTLGRFNRINATLFGRTSTSKCS